MSLCHPVSIYLHVNLHTHRYSRVSVYGFACIFECIHVHDMPARMDRRSHMCGDMTLCTFFFSLCI